jgi:hypothetical protein
MRRRLAALGVALAIVVLASGVVLAASKTIPNDGVFYACYDSGGAVKFIDYSATQNCPKGWTGPVTWNQSGLIGISTLGEIDNNFWEFTEDESGLTVLSVWAETGSANGACLATMNEARNGVAVNGLYCSSRTAKLEDGQWHNGVYLHVFLDAPLPEGSGFWVNVYQEGAKFYGVPRKCDMDGCI